mmetsp:Transcript_8691/g.16974  ORF Transcript_8691/g.16974 Transcript_8691/m.16974 type:complete len:198 (+) Transcript_8691:2396-2989(+)
MSYLDDYLASIKYLPSEVTRSLELIGDLDGKIKKLSDELEKMKVTFFKYKGDSELRVRIEEVQKEVGDLTDEKIVIVKQLCEAVIKHKQRLEQDLTMLDRTLKNVNLQEDTTAKRRKDERSTEDFNLSYYVSDFPAEEFPGQDAETRKYCICNQESYGNMVECDNKHCEREWFHYECVGLNSPPRGQWYCPDCSSRA